MRTTVHALDGTLIPGNGISEALRNLEFYNSLELVKPAGKYLVTWGADDGSAEFPTFAAALGCYRAHLSNRFGVRIYGEGYDCDCDEGGFRMVSDGLTDEEREAVEAADEAHVVVIEVPQSIRRSA